VKFKKLNLLFMPKEKTYSAYCVKCKKKIVMEDPKLKVIKGRRFMIGTCPKCGTKVARILGKKD